MEWTDKAILLTVAKAGKRTLILEVLTQHHGRCRCVTSFTGGSSPMLLPGSFLAMTCSIEGFDKPLLATLSRITGGIIAEKSDDIGLVVLSTAKDLLVSLLPLEQPAPDVYGVMRSMMSSLVRNDGRWPMHYAMWEFALLCEIGKVEGVQRCRPAFRHGETIYMSPRSGALHTREEAGAFLDKMQDVPGFLLGGKTINMVSVRQAMELNQILLERFALPETQGGLPALRAKLEWMIQRTRELPPEAQEDETEIDEEARRNRIEAMRPLMVASRSMGA